MDRETTRIRSLARAAADILGNARRTLAMVVGVDRASTLALAACNVYDAGFSIAAAWVGKRIIDALVAAATSPGHSPRAALSWAAVELGLVLVRNLQVQFQTYAYARLRAEMDVHVNTLILEKAANVSYGHFEDPEFNNRMNQARQAASSRPISVIDQSFGLARQLLTLAGYALLLSALGPWAVLAMMASSALPFVSETYFGRKRFVMQKARSQRNRRLYYLESVLTQEASVKEVKIFALAQWLIGRYREIHLGFQAEELGHVKARTGWAATFGTVSSLVFYGVYALIVLRTATGAITLGAMTLYITVFRQGQQSIGGALRNVAQLYEDNLFMTNLFEYLGVPDDEPDEPIDPSRPLVATAARVEFDHVGFTYEGASRPALNDVSFVIEPGRTIALVGRNGAGKTTLIKLLVGLYKPTSGRILIDGVDASTMTAAALRRSIGVIFQDFVRFQFSARDNIGVGWLPSREDPREVDRAVHDAGAEAVVARLPQGLDSPLGRAFGGDDLSVGQWQRVALARAFMRHSRIVVLDEPTAAMDAEGEHEIFQRFRDLKHGRTAILITHRFSTVRMADQIVVFEDGRVAEQGSHADLMAQDGRYATMFRIQAAGYALGEGAAS